MDRCSLGGTNHAADYHEAAYFHPNNDDRVLSNLYVETYFDASVTQCAPVIFACVMLMHSLLLSRGEFPAAALQLFLQSANLVQREDVYHRRSKVEPERAAAIALRI